MFVRNTFSAGVIRSYSNPNGHELAREMSELTLNPSFGWKLDDIEQVSSDGVVVAPLSLATHPAESLIDPDLQGYITLYLTGFHSSYVFEVLRYRKIYP